MGLSILFIANLIGGAFSPLFIKLGVKEIPPLTFTLLRFMVATLVFLPFFLKKKEKLFKSDIKKISLYSILFALNVAFFSIGLQFTTAIVSQILYTLVPLIVGISSYFILKEKFTKFKIVGSIIAFAGVCLLIFESFKKIHISSIGSPLGNLFIFAAVISWSLYIVFSRKLTAKYNSETTSFVSFVTTIIILLPFAFFEIIVRPTVWSGVSSIAYGSIFGAGIISSALMFFLIQVGIKKTSAYTASLFMYFAPLFGSITAIPILQEKITLELVGGGILIILGVFIATTLEHILKTGRILK